jgi:hypothetical protein
MLCHLRKIASAVAITLVAGGSALLWQSATVSHAMPALPSAPFVSWQSRVEGQPSSFYAGSAAGVYFWHNEPAGLSLRTTDPPGYGHEYRGTISTDGTIFNLSAYQLEADDSYSLGPRGEILTFDFHTADGVDGVDFEVSGGTGLKLGVQWNDPSCGGSLCSMPTNYFYLGANNVSAENNPLWVCREDNGACLRNLP